MPSTAHTAHNNTNKTETHAPFSKQEFAQLIEQHGSYIKSFLSKKVWNPQDVNDLYQITLMEAFRSYKKFRRESSPKTWLCGIAYTVFKNYLYKKLKKPANDLEIDAFLDTAQSHDDYCIFETEGPEAIYEREEMFHTIHGIYKTLPVGMQETVNLVIGKGISYQNASDISGIPVGTVRSRVSRARSLMREQYKTASA